MTVNADQFFTQCERYTEKPVQDCTKGAKISFEDHEKIQAKLASMEKYRDPELYGWSTAALSVPDCLGSARKQRTDSIKQHLKESIGVEEVPTFDEMRKAFEQQRWDWHGVAEKLRKNGVDRAVAGEYARYCWDKARKDTEAPFRELLRLYQRLDNRGRIRYPGRKRYFSSLTHPVG